MNDYQQDPLGDDGVADENTSLLQSSKVNSKASTQRETRMNIGWRRQAVTIVLVFALFGMLLAAEKVQVLRDSFNSYTMTSFFYRRRQRRHRKRNSYKIPDVAVAFIGNSFTFFNDLPRFIQALSDDHITQNSCLHPSVSFRGILNTGSGMFDKFNTGSALNKDGVFDFGACTVKQLLLGYDEDLEEQVFNKGKEVYINDGTNPCLQYPYYLTYLNTHTFGNNTPQWDYVVLSDTTRGPDKRWHRAVGMNNLEDVYIPWFLETGATPIFYDTHGYSNGDRTLDNVPTFTSLTYFGYEEYTSLVSEFLPRHQAARIAPVGIAFLTVWEENRGIWYKLFHSLDLEHASTSGTFLTGCVIYYAIYGRMPERDVVFRNRDVSALWSKARVLHEEPPSLGEAKYLYTVAERVMRLGHLPKSLKVY